MKEIEREIDKSKKYDRISREGVRIEEGKKLKYNNENIKIDSN